MRDASSRLTKSKSVLNHFPLVKNVTHFFFRWSGISGLRTTSSFLSQFSPFYGSTEKCFYLVTLFFLKLAVVDWHWEVEGVVIRFSHSSTSISVTLDLFWFHEWRVLTKGCG